MRTVRVSQEVRGTVAQAELCWYDTAAWPRWIDGCDRVLGVDAAWPGLGASVVWESGPAGRGRVSERVVAFEPLEGQTVEIEDGSISGRQSVAFLPLDVDAVSVELSLAYQLRRHAFLSAPVDLLFIRRAMIASLDTTLRRFGAELEASLRQPRPSPDEH